MKALSFTVLVAPSGVGVKVTGCGGERWSSFFFTLLQCAIFLPCFFFVLPVYNTLASDVVLWFRIVSIKFLIGH
jgi:uncharacterized membrane protein (DUF2068 family)